jgi:hypothetical protein
MAQCTSLCEEEIIEVGKFETEVFLQISWNYAGAFHLTHYPIPHKHHQIFGFI